MLPKLESAPILTAFKWPVNEQWICALLVSLCLSRKASMPSCGETCCSFFQSFLQAILSEMCAVWEDVCAVPEECNFEADSHRSGTPDVVTGRIKQLDRGRSLSGIEQTPNSDTYSFLHKCEVYKLRGFYIIALNIPGHICVSWQWSQTQMQCNQSISCPYFSLVFRGPGNIFTLTWAKEMYEFASTCRTRCLTFDPTRSILSDWTTQNFERETLQ